MHLLTQAQMALRVKQKMSQPRIHFLPSVEKKVKNDFSEGKDMRVFTITSQDERNINISNYRLSMLAFRLHLIIN